MVEAPIRDIVQDESESALTPPMAFETSKDFHKEIFILHPRRALSSIRDIDNAWSGERAIYERELDEFREDLYGLAASEVAPINK